MTTFSFTFVQELRQKREDEQTEFERAAESTHDATGGPRNRVQAIGCKCATGEWPQGGERMFMMECAWKWWEINKKKLPICTQNKFHSNLYVFMKEGGGGGVSSVVVELQQTVAQHILLRN